MVRQPQYLDDYVQFATLTTVEHKEHEVRTKTLGQKQKLVKKLMDASRNNLPTTYESIDRCEDADAYRSAIKTKLEAIGEREVLGLFPRNTVLRNSEVGKLAWILSRKRNGSYKARLIYNGFRQRYKISPNHSAPTLSPTSLRLALAVAAQRKYKFRTLDIKTAFLYATLPSKTHLFAEIPPGHSDYDKRDTHVLRVKRALYGLRESPHLWYRHLIQFLTNDLHLRQSIYD